MKYFITISLIILSWLLSISIITVAQEKKLISQSGYLVIRDNQAVFFPNKNASTEFTLRFLKQSEGIILFGFDYPSYINTDNCKSFFVIQVYYNDADGITYRWDYHYKIAPVRLTYTSWPFKITQNHHVKILHGKKKYDAYIRGDMSTNVEKLELVNN